MLDMSTPMGGGFLCFGEGMDIVMEVEILVLVCL